MTSKKIVVSCNTNDFYLQIFAVMKNLFQFLCLSLLIVVFACNDSSDKVSEAVVNNESHLGEVNFKVSGAEAAQPYFVKGLLLLHSFEYEDSREAFLQAQEKDPTFAMAYWGEAMTYNHSLWQRQEKEKAIEALEKLAPDATSRSALAKTELEKDFLAATEILFGAGTKNQRDKEYNKYMEDLCKKYPDHQEVSAFYAVSLLGASRNGRDAELYEKCARIAQGIIKENPQHPGALHYLIHSYDDPVHAHLAKSAADSYSKTAPDAAHALHMPSHIYVALGKWNDVINSNIASWNASVKRKQRKTLGTEALSYHAFNWLQYGLLQRGEIEQAAQLAEDMIQYQQETSTKPKPAKSYLIAMLGAQMVETGAWDKYENISIDPSDLNITKRTGWAFLKGMEAYHKKDEKKLGEWIARIEADRKEADYKLNNEGAAMCSTAGFANKPPSLLDINMVHVMELELEAYRATLNEKMEVAGQLFQQAMELDESLSYSYGPPTILKPVHEAYGEWLLEQEQPRAALEIFNKALERQPRRLRSLQGKKMAAELINHNSALAEVSQELAISTEKKERGEIL